MAGPNDEILGVLRGGVTPASHHVGLANTILGVGIGAQCDAGKTDEQIIQLCTFMLGRVRAALAQPETQAELVRIATKIKDGPDV